MQKESRLDKLERYFSNLNLCIKSESLKYYTTFKEIITIINQYISFDPILPEKVSILLSKCYACVFHAIRYYGKGKFFKEVYAQYLNHIQYLHTKEVHAEIAADLSFIFWMFNDLDKAIEEGKKSIELLERSGNTLSFTGRYSNVGYIYECKGELDLALSYYQRGIQYGFYINNEEVLALAYTGLGRISAMRSDIKHAIHYFLEAKKRISDHNSDNYLSICNNLAIAYGSIGMNEKALEHLEPFINEDLKEKDPDSYITFLVNASNAYKRLNKFSKVEELLNKALESARSLPYYNDIASILISLGNLRISNSEYDEALNLFLEAQKRNDESKDTRHKLIILQGIITCQIKLAKFKQALENLKVAKKLAEEMKLLKEMAVNYKLYSQVYEELADLENSLKYYKLYCKLEIQIKNEQYKKEVEIIKQEKNKEASKPNNFLYYAGSSLISQELNTLVKTPLIGCSKAMQALVKEALMIAKNSDLSVLVHGETGSGKEVIARIIHYASKRKSLPFVAVNSASFSTSLVESSFFGSEKGAYTGSAKRTIGYIESAKNGTLFLDEISEMPLVMQSKFLRVLENKTINRVGSTKDIKVDFRLISATNKDLSELAMSNSFRFDLLNRINVIEIKIPPLRERMEDIPLLIDYYLNKLSLEQGKQPPVITKEAFNMLTNYSYPGNIRELKNILQRSILLAKEVIDVDKISLFENTDGTKDNGLTIPSLDLSECEEWIIRKAMERSKNVQKNAAVLLGISPYTLSRKLKRIKEKKE